MNNRGRAASAPSVPRSSQSTHAERRPPKCPLKQRRTTRQKGFSSTGTRTLEAKREKRSDFLHRDSNPVHRVRAGYPDQLDYRGIDVDMVPAPLLVPTCLTTEWCTSASTSANRHDRTVWHAERWHRTNPRPNFTQWPPHYSQYVSQCAAPASAERPACSHARAGANE